MKTSVRDQMPDSSVLLRRARIPDLRASSTAELREIRTELVSACEIARRAAIGKLVRDKENAKGESPAEANCGFAGLFAALRRVRAELSRRKARTEPKTTAPRSRRADDARRPTITARL